MTILGRSVISRAWAYVGLGLLVTALVITFVVMGFARDKITPSPMATACPDPIACHALKRKPTTVIQP